MSRLIHEGKQEGVVPIARGKINWVTKEESEHLGLMTNIFEGTDVEESEINDFKESLIKSLRKKGFVFFDETLYRYRINQRGRITEFGVSYMKID